MNLIEAVADYCSAWNEPDVVARRSLLSASITPDAVYIDPTVELSGIDALLEHIASVDAKYPASHVQRLGTIDAHHSVARFRWRRVLADGTARPESIDVVDISPDGKLSRIVGFFGPI